MATRRRRRKQSVSTGEATVLIAGGFVVLSIMVASSPTLARLVAAVIVAMGVAAVALSVAFVGDVALSLLDWFGHRSRRGLRLTRPTLRIVLFPVVLFGRFQSLFREPPIRVETLGELLALTPTQFEHAIAQSLRDRGYRKVERCGGPGDLGVDITCHDPNGERLAIQCKRYGPGNRVGSREIQLFIGMVTTEHPVDRGVFITTSGYTKPAQALAERHGIRLIDGRGLVRILDSAAPPLPAPPVPS